MNTTLNKILPLIKLKKNHVYFDLKLLHIVDVPEFSTLLKDFTIFELDTDDLNSYFNYYTMKIQLQFKFWDINSGESSFKTYSDVFEWDGMYEKTNQQIEGYPQGNYVRSSLEDESGWWLRKKPYRFVFANAN